MTKGFASANDLAEKKITFSEIGTDLYAFTAEGDPNSAVIVGDDGCIVFDAQATPALAGKVIERVRTVTDKPIKYVVLSHYHAVRVLGASAYQAQGVVASAETHRLVQERGQQDWDSEFGRFPRLFQGSESIPGLTWPTIVFERELTMNLGNFEVRILQPGPGHTRGDTIAWIPSQGIVFSGDLVEFNAGVYTGDAHLEEWPATLDKLAALKPQQLVPGRGPALQNEADSLAAIDYTRRWVQTLLACARDGVKQGHPLKQVYADTRKVMDPIFGHVFIYEHCIAFDVARAYDEAQGITNPRIWTDQRDREMWAEVNG